LSHLNQGRLAACRATEHRNSTKKMPRAGFGGLPGASMASDEMVVGFDRRGGVTKLRLTDPLMQRAEQSTLWITASEDGASATCVGVAPACKDLRSGPNKSEREPTSARSTDYGSGHLIPAFHGTGRTFSLLPSHPLDAASRSIDAPWSRA
jgi:hypothetical protein